MCSVQRRELVSLDLAGEPNRRRSQLKGQLPQGTPAVIAKLSACLRLDRL
jgi:hypothetical protein